ncbi:MAG: hypothetical protein ACE5G8_04440 [Anaerolineae bacterium]
MTPRLYRACARAVHVITVKGQVIKAGRAVLCVLEEIGYPRRLVRIFGRPPLVWGVELGYRLVERHRPFFGKFLFTGK